MKYSMTMGGPDYGERGGSNRLDTEPRRMPPSTLRLSRRSPVERAAGSPSSSNFARWYLSRTFIATLDVAARSATLSLRMPAHKLRSAESE